MAQGLSDKVREVALTNYVQPALRDGRKQFSIRVKDLMDDLREEGFPENRIPQICKAPQKSQFLREHGLAIEGVDGPPSKTSSTVVIRLRVVGSDVSGVAIGSRSHKPETPEESPKARVRRLAGRLKGLLKEEFAEYGGGEAFLRWVRDEDAR